MPAPDPKLTAEVQQAIDNFDSTSQSCGEAFTQSTPAATGAKLDDFISFLRTAEQHLSSADTVLVALAPVQ